MFFYFTGQGQVFHAEGEFRGFGTENEALLCSPPMTSTLIAIDGDPGATVAPKTTQKSPVGNNGRPNEHSK